MGDFLLIHWQIVLATTLVAIVIVFALLSLREGPLPYERKHGLLSPAEITFLRSLQNAVREDWIVFSMVRLADIIKVSAKTRQFQSWQNQIFGRHVDFVLCDQETLEVKLAIELDDATQRRPDRTKRDAFVNNAMAAAGLPLMRIRVDSKYESAILRKDIENALGIIHRKKKR